MKYQVLVSSLSRKVPLVRTLKKALEKLPQYGGIIGGDTNPNCIGRYFVDAFWDMPALSTLSIEALVDFCHRKNVKAIIPTRDGELAYYATYRSYLSEQGIHVMVSSEVAVESCFDKLRFFQALSQMGYPAIPTAETLTSIPSGMVVVKERFGAGSRSIGLDLKPAEAKEYACNLKSPVFQPFISGMEMSVDLYLSQQGKAVGCVVRKREVVVNGESQITVTVRHPELEALCIRLAEALGLYGHVMFQVMIDSKGHFHVIECNPRFGGASGLSVAVGLDSFTWFLREALGKALPGNAFQRSSAEKRQIRYAADWILDV